ncbi:fumarate hydratase C-terminal domain-containing protein [Nisaea denitrificans]|uniref:fumarate hydratase C-terminal domain-containing protein n=1 Tax=Nisaea denitrificans TaxID=390877 RepID=UPI00040C2580|nr:fumarate hydratase C-terminal domain-containing protein [Nisaea denitrificans]
MGKAPERKTVRLKTPVTDEALAALELGDVVYLDGLIYTAREGVYKKILADGAAPPAPFAELGNVNFHCSPAAVQQEDGSLHVSAVTATASFRFSKWMKDWFAASGAKMVIGKGGMSEEDYKTLFVPAGAVYLTTVGYGTGALLGRGIKNVKAAHWLDELGIAQAMWVLEVEKFGPLLVESDHAGNSLFERNNREINEGIDKLYEGLKKPSLQRFGETDDREQELI